MWPTGGNSGKDKVGESGIGRAEEVVAFSFKIGTQRKKQESAVRD